MRTPLAPYVIRPAEAGDRGYIIDTWLQTYRSSPFARKLPDFAYWSRFGHVGLVEWLADTDARFTVACLPGDPRFIYGWSAWSLDLNGCTYNEPQALHYVFVRMEYRQQGFGSQLLAALKLPEPLRVTHVTPDFSRFLAKGREVEFCNPYRSERR